MTATSTQLEIWGGIECTINRVQNRYHSQLEQNGHLHRLEDLDRLADLGLKTLRYPVLWEQLAPESLDQVDWSWADARLGRLRELNINPIAGLVHHGSGPKYTSLVDPNFPELLARYAAEVAKRYPWLTDFTPVNEPLTTARFSGLYGLWYPHGFDDLTFAAALLNECRGTVLAMRAIREIIPNARLVQTDDLGRIHSTPALKYQANFENERRWLTFDLLCGKVNQKHRFWRWFKAAGVKETDLTFFLENPTPPDVIGINHYLTSDRFLDNRKELYPGEAVGTNGRHRYVDVAAVRVLDGENLGPRVALREVWERYGLPVVVTEAHLGCTREEQMRWLHEIWTAATELRAEGANIQAVTVWALLGLVDWDSLLTRFHGHYEPGSFDVRGPKPRATALAGMIAGYARTGSFEHPLLASPGWWRRRIRFLPTVAGGQEQCASCPDNTAPVDIPTSFVPRNSKMPVKPVLILGATGTLGRAFARVCHIRGVAYHLLNRSEMDIANVTSVNNALAEYQPWAVINAAGFVRVDDAEREAEACFRENCDGPAVLAASCRAHGARLLTFSSDLVFAGNQEKPYVESDLTAPLNQYGASKAEMESRVSEILPEALVVRTSAFFGPWDEYNFVCHIVNQLQSNKTIEVSTDQISPTYVPDLVHAALDLLVDGETGIWHLANDGAVSWFDFARRIADQAGFPNARIQAKSAFELGWKARRPTYSVLGSERGKLMPSLDNAISRYFEERPIEVKQAAA
jgi:dTDP-4-dehydrorhamnose reductase